MTVDILKVIGEIGSIGVLLMVLYFVWKYGGGFVSRLMDNLDQQAENNKAAIAAQQNLGHNLEKVCDRLNRPDQATMQALNRILEALEVNTGVLHGIVQTLSKHDGQTARRDAELIKRLEAMNGKEKESGG